MLQFRDPTVCDRLAEQTISPQPPLGTEDTRAGQAQLHSGKHLQTNFEAPNGECWHSFRPIAVAHLPVKVRTLGKIKLR